MNYIVLKNIDAKFHFQEIQNDLTCLGNISINHVIQSEATKVDVVIRLNNLPTHILYILYEDGSLDFLSKSGKFYTMEIFYNEELHESTFSCTTSCVSSTLKT